MELRRCCLRYPYLSIKNQNETSFGGSQTWCRSWVMRKYGCGVVAMSDVLLYLGLHRPGCDTELFDGLLLENGCLSGLRYERYLRKMRRRYLGVLPFAGVPCFFVPLAMNRYFRHYRLPLTARWCISGRKILPRIQESLARDIPVILAIGQNLPFRRRAKLPFYRQENGVYLPAARTRGHFVTVTGMQDGYLQVSSWGREYYISWQEFQTYAQRSSSFRISNICQITPKKRGGGSRKDL